MTIRSKKSKVSSNDRPDVYDSSSDGENNEISNDKLKPPTNVLTLASRRSEALRETTTNDIRLPEKLQYIISKNNVNLENDFYWLIS